MSALLTVRNLTKEFESRRGIMQKPRVVRAVDDVSFEVLEGETFGLVGESGSGKSTTGRCILRLIEPTAGEVLFRGRNLLSLPAEEMRLERRNLQIVFQDPFSSLNPRLRVRQIVEEPLVIHGIGDRASRKARVEELFGLVGLDPSQLDRFPHQFSGGQRQRIGLARALALNPSLIIADEPVSALDVSVQAQVVNLLMDLQARLKLTYLFIAHDLRLVRQICDRVAVIYRGRIVELSEAERVFSQPRHAYTRALLSAIPLPDPSRRPSRVPFDGSTFDRSLPLREVEPGHWAAVYRDRRQKSEDRSQQVLRTEGRRSRPSILSSVFCLLTSTFCYWQLIIRQLLMSTFAGLACRPVRRG